MRRVAIFGVGSPFGDDQAGWAAAQAIRDSDWVRGLRALHVECLDRPGAALIGKLHGISAAVVIDAMRSGALPGSVHVLRHEEIDTVSRPAASSHGFGLVQALALAEALGELPAALTLIGIEAGTETRIDRLSPAVSAALPTVVARTGAIVRAALGISAAACG